MQTQGYEAHYKLCKLRAVKHTANCTNSGLWSTLQTVQTQGCEVLVLIQTGWFSQIVLLLIKLRAVKHCINVLCTDRKASLTDFLLSLYESLYEFRAVKHSVKRKIVKSSNKRMKHS